MIVLVTGTDTGVGKTVVTVALARALRASGAAVRAIKPFETGCGVAGRVGPPTDDEDGVRLARAAAQVHPGAALVRLARPLAPPVAAEAEGVALDFGAVVDQVRSIASQAAVTLIEGAGGLLAPLTWDETARELALALRAVAVVVAPDRLGVLSHLGLTVEALRAAGTPVLGVVLSAPETSDDATGRNAAAYRRLRGSVPLWPLSRAHDEHARELASLAALMWSPSDAS